jgi:hypothetical protein
MTVTQDNKVLRIHIISASSAMLKQVQHDEIFIGIIPDEKI